MTVEGSHSVADRVAFFENVKVVGSASRLHFSTAFRATIIWFGKLWAELLFN